MSHFVAPNHNFVLVKNDSVQAIYSAQHLGRVNSKKNKEQNLDPQNEYQILSKEDWLEKRNELIEIEFIPQYSPEYDKNGNPIVKKTMIHRFEVGGHTDPRRDSFWAI